MAEFDWSDERRMDAWSGWWRITESPDKYPHDAAWVMDLEHVMDSNESLEIGLYNHVRNAGDEGEVA